MHTHTLRSRGPLEIKLHSLDKNVHSVILSLHLACTRCIAWNSFREARAIVDADGTC